MNKLRIVTGLFLISVSSFSILMATGPSFKSGAREAALANSVLTLGGTWSAWHNPAGMALVNAPAIGIAYTNRYQLPELSTRSLAGSLPVLKGAIGVTYSYFGDQDYNEQKLAAGYAHPLGEKVFAGILIDYYSTRLPSEYDRASAIAGEIGFLAKPTEQLAIGMHLSNLSNVNYNQYMHEELPMFLNSGITYSVKDFLISANLLLPKNANPSFGVGTEVNLIKNLGVRVGISNTEAFNFCFGFGYRLDNFRADIAFNRHPNLGYVSQLSFEYIPAVKR